MKHNPILWLDDHRGRYIPRDFANSFSDRASTVKGVDAETWEILEDGPDHEFYWEAWQEVENSARVIIDGHQYRVYQDGDCWLIPDGMEWSDNAAFFVWPAEPELDTSTIGIAEGRVNE
jgi:hypothetical protein